MNKEEIKNLIGDSKYTKKIIFEIGCADGGDTIDFVEKFKEFDFDMYCFEPEPTNIEIFKNRKFHNNIHLFEGVVGDVDGVVEFNRSRDVNCDHALRYSGSINQPKEHLNEWPSIIFDERINVQMTTLDHFCREKSINYIDFIWADVQGAEDKLIKGAKNILKNTKYLYTEYSNKEYYSGQIGLKNIIDLISSDWVIVKDFGTDVLLKNKKL